MGRKELTAWYAGVRVVILCRFRACSKKKSFTLSAILGKGDRYQSVLGHARNPKECDEGTREEKI